MTYFIVVFRSRSETMKFANILNSYGFNFKCDDLGIDKLRTLYYGKEMFSENQNG